MFLLTPILPWSPPDPLSSKSLQNFSQEAKYDPPPISYLIKFCTIFTHEANPDTPSPDPLFYQLSDKYFAKYLELIPWVIEATVIILPLPHK